MALDEEITLKKLEVFLSFMRLNNMARVSEALGQSTVSVHRALHSLEEGLRCQLFKREGRNLIPLQTAYTFAEFARRTIEECEEGVRKVREAAGINPAQLKIGSLYSLTLQCIPQIFVRMKLRKPELNLNLTLGSNRELLQSLEEGRLDAIVIGLHEDNHDSNLVSVPLFYDEMFLAAALGSPYANRKTIDLGDLRDEKFVTLSEGFATTQDFNLAFERAGYLPNIAMPVGDIFSLINLVSGGMGYSLLPGRVAAFSQRMQLIALDQKYASRQLISLLIPKSRERDPNLLALAAECRMYGRNENDVLKVQI